MFKPYLISTAHQKVLDFFITHPDQSLYGVELAKKIKLSSSAINNVLKEFQRAGILEKNRRGKTDLYTLKDNQPIINQLKILSTLLRLEVLVKELKPLTHKIILYGSSRHGTNDQQSDIDLLIVASNTNKDLVKTKIENYQRKENDLPKVQTAIKTTVQWSTLEDNDPTYFQETLKGLTLWDSARFYDENKNRL